jgi:hypothetical protein
MSRIPATTSTAVAAIWSGVAFLGIACYTHGMRFRQVAALAIVAWYLLVPPLDKARQNEPNAPLREWKILGSYNQASECRNDKEKVAASIKQSSLAIAPHILLGIQYSQCVAADDPRLKPN